MRDPGFFLRLVVLLVFAAVFAAACSGGTDAPDDTDGPAVGTEVTSGNTVQFSTGDGEGVILSVEVADSPEERATGLMNRESLPENAGMLFDFGVDGIARFWMKDTLLPLSIAFISSDGEILHIEDMEPLTEDLHTSPSPFRYAIEVNQGWYDSNGIQVGDTVQLSTE